MGIKGPPANLGSALASCVSGDIYSLRKSIRAGFDPSEKNYLCITDAARVGQTHIVEFLLETKPPPKDVIKKMTNICATEHGNETLRLIVRKTGVYSSNAVNNALASGNNQIVDYLMDRELYENIGEFYTQYKHLPQRINKLLTYDNRKYRNGEPEPIAFANVKDDVLRVLRGVIYKHELQTMLQICCRESLKNAADLLFLATEISRGKGIGIQDYRVLTDEGKNSPLTHTVSFGTLDQYLNLKNEGRFLGSELQKNNLGYTLCLAIKNRNFEIASDLIKEDYCPQFQLGKVKEILFKEDNFNLPMIIKNLIREESHTGKNECAQLLNQILSLKDNILGKTGYQLLKEGELKKSNWNHALSAIKTGKEQIAKTLLKSIDIKDLLENNYYNTNPPDYVLAWLSQYRKQEIIKNAALKAPALVLD